MLGLDCDAIDMVGLDVIAIGAGLSNTVAGWFDHICKRLPSCSIIPDSNAGVSGAAALCYAWPAVMEVRGAAL